MSNYWDKLLSEVRVKTLRDPNHTPSEPKEFDKRSQFEGDLSRLIFSPHVRRMHDKTQVFPLLSDDNTHTRLTHSLEVAMIGYSLGLVLLSHDKSKHEFANSELAKSIPIILATVGLAHDIGNPPFGHFGEEVIGDYFDNLFSDGKINLNDEEMGDFIYYNGNAQGFRTITKLSPLENIFSLNLTVGTLAIFLKYPNTSKEVDVDNKYEYRTKLGVYQSEKEFLASIRKETGQNKYQRHPLSFIAEAADSICYRIMDIEDGYNNNLYSYQNIIDWFKKYANDNNYLIAQKKIIEYEKSLSNLDKSLTNIDTIRIVKFRLFMIYHLIESAIVEFQSNLSKIKKYNYHTELLDNCEINIIAKKFFKKMILGKSKDINISELTGKKVIEGILGHLIDGLINKNHINKYNMLISSSFKTAIFYETNAKNINELNDYWKLRLIVDYLSGMTDNHALKTYRRLEGIRFE